MANPTKAGGAKLKGLNQYVKLNDMVCQPVTEDGVMCDVHLLLDGLFLSL
jgi:hypothetical protein